MYSSHFKSQHQCCWSCGIINSVCSFAPQLCLCVFSTVGPQEEHMLCTEYTVSDTDSMRSPKKKTAASSCLSYQSLYISLLVANYYPCIPVKAAFYSCRWISDVELLFIPHWQIRLFWGVVQNEPTFSYLQQIEEE